MPHVPSENSLAARIPASGQLLNLNLNYEKLRYKLNKI